MNLKEGIDISIKEVLNEDFIKSITESGFVFFEKQNKFKIENGEFKCDIKFNSFLDHVYLNSTGGVRFNVHFDTDFYSSKLRAWLDKNLKSIYPDKSLMRIHESFVIYSKIFDENHHNFNEIEKIKTYILSKSLSIFSQFSNWNIILSNPELANKIDELENVYLFLNMKEQASQILNSKKAIILEKENITNNHHFNRINYTLQKIFGEKVDNINTNYNKIKTFETFKIEGNVFINSEFKITNLPKIENLFTSENGQNFITVHENGRGILWDKNGDKIFENKIIKIGESAYTEIRAGFIESLNLWYLDQYFYSIINGELKFKIELNDDKKPSKQLRIYEHFFLKNKEVIIGQFDDKNLGFFDKKGDLINRFKINGKLVNINQKNEELFIYKDSTYSILSIDNSVKSTLPSVTFNSIHKFTEDFSLFFTGGHQTKQYLYDLKNNKKTTVWAHPTYEPNYKEQFKVSHNFGCNNMVFSTDENKIAICSSHGRHTIFTLPKLDRIELKSREHFGYEWETTEFKYMIKSMEFFQSKLLFTTIEDNLIIWSLDGNLLYKIEGICKFILTENPNYLIGVDKDSNLIKLVIED